MSKPYHSRVERGFHYRAIRILRRFAESNKMIPVMGNVPHPMLVKMKSS